MIEKIKKQWFLLSLVSVFALVVGDKSNILAETGMFLKDWHAPEIMIFLVFIISGLLIESSHIKDGIKDYKSTLLALSLILFFAPVAAILLSILPFDTGLVIGIFIVASMPTTLSSGVVMTGASGGNMAHALFVTILSNFIGIVSIPIVLSILLSFIDLEKTLVIDQTAIVIKLSFLVLLPLVIGMVVKANFLKTEQLAKYKLQIMNQAMITVIVFISLGGAKQVLLETGSLVIQVIFLVTVFHLMLLGFSFLLIKIFKVEKGRYESIVFMGSQKTLPLSIMIQVTYFSEFGVAVLVCIIHHVVHLMIDGYLSTKIRS
jgi:sodium/bile acid cotransporter 7